MITNKQFLDAVDIIKRYSEQINLQLPNTQPEPEKTTLKKFLLIKGHEMSGRLSRILEMLCESKEIPKHLEDITQYQFGRHRNVGIKAWREFDKCRSEFLSNKPV